MKVFSTIVALLALVITGYIGMTNLDTPLTLAGIGFIGWALSPYLLLMILVKFTKRRLSLFVLSVLTFLVGVFGLVMFADAFYLHPDPQAGLVFAAVPFWQWSAILIVSLSLPIIGKARKRG